VLAITGNHEYYSDRSAPVTVAQVQRKIRDFCHTLPNVIFVDRRVVEINNVRVLGCTLWTHIPETVKRVVASTVNDYQLIYVESGEGVRKIKTEGVLCCVRAHFLRHTMRGSMIGSHTNINRRCPMA
jgi:hypothetical protein